MSSMLDSVFGKSAVETAKNDMTAHTVTLATKRSRSSLGPANLSKLSDHVHSWLDCLDDTANRHRT